MGAIVLFSRDFSVAVKSIHGESFANLDRYTTLIDT